MKNGKKYASIIALVLCVSCFLSSCGGPAGKIQKNIHTKYYYEDVESDYPSDTENLLNDEETDNYSSQVDNGNNNEIAENTESDNNTASEYNTASNIDTASGNGNVSEENTVSKSDMTSGNNTVSEDNTVSKDNTASSDNTTSANNNTTDNKSSENNNESEENKDNVNTRKLAIIKELETLKETLPEEMPLYADDDESFPYSIVYPANSQRTLTIAIRTLRSTVQNKLYASAESPLTDSESPKEKDAELLIGNTNRSFSEKLLNRLKSNRKNCNDDFIIATEGNKIGIVGGSNNACVKAVEWFTKTFCASERTWTYLRKGYEFIYAPEYDLKEITVASSNIFDYSIVTPNETEYVYGRAIDDFIDMVATDLHYGMSREYEHFVNSESKNELLIGDLNRVQSKAVIPGTDEYVIKVTGDKIVIKGYDSICLYYGIEAFSKLIKDAAKSGKSLSLKDGYTLSSKIDKSSDSVYKLIFGDEFDGTILDAMWTGYDGNTSGENSVFSNGKIINKGRSNDYQYVENGILHLLSKRIKDDKGSTDFGEAKITLKRNLWYKYGCLEVRAKLAENPAHCAIWLNGGAEIDILENFSSVTNFKSNIHKWFSRYLWDGTRDDGHISIEGSGTYDAARNYKIDVERYGDLTDDFHTYSLDWTEEFFRFAVDGKTYFRYDYAENEDEVDFFGRELYLILVCGCGSNSYGARYVPEAHDKLDENGNYVPFDFQVDYVRLYQNPSTDGVNYNRTQ